MTADVCNFDYFTVRACVIRSDSGLMTKRIRLIDGVLDKQPAASAWTGLYRPIEFCGNANDILAALSRELHAFTAREALVNASLPAPAAPDGEPWRLRLKREPDDGVSLAREKAVFGPVDGPALAFFDFDIPAALRPRIPDTDALIDLLSEAWEGFDDVAMLVRPSVSSGVRIVGQELPPPSGYHVYAVADCGAVVGEVAMALFDRLAMMGYASMEPSTRGSRLRRALVDVTATKGAERLIFEANARLVGPGLERVPRTAVLYEGGLLRAVETRVALRGATHNANLAFIWAEAERKARPALEAARAAWLETRTEEIVLESKVAPPVARQIAEREMRVFEAGVLAEDVRIYLDDGTCPSVGEILAEPARFHGKTGYSIDEATPRPRVTYICAYRRKADPSMGRPAGPYLHSFEHGGRYWRLQSDRLNREAVRMLIRMKGRST